MNGPLLRVPIEAGPDIGREVVLAEPIPGESCYRLRSIPAFAYGLASGDTFRVIDPASGKFVVLDRGQQVTVRVFVTGSLERPDIHSLIKAVLQAHGQYEVGRNDAGTTSASLLLLSLDVKIGFATIESMLRVAEGPDVRWEYGNVYDANGAPLNWWAH